MPSMELPAYIRMSFTTQAEKKTIGLDYVHYTCCLSDVIRRLHEGPMIICFESTPSPRTLLRAASSAATPRELVITIFARHLQQQRHEVSDASEDDNLCSDETTQQARAHYTLVSRALCAD